MNKKNHNRVRWICWILFLAYLLCLVYFLFLSETFGRQGVSERVYRYNLVPFQEIRRFWIYRDKVGHLSAWLNLGGNIAAFLPFGFFLPVLCPPLRRPLLTGLLGFVMSLVVETLQLVSRVGSFDVDDLILNTLGAFCGYVFFALSHRVWRWIASLGKE